MKKYMLKLLEEILIGIAFIFILALVFWPTEFRRRDDKIDELCGESLDNDNKKYHRTQREIDSLFNVIDQEYANETSHSKRMDLQYQRSQLQLANSMNSTKLTMIQLDSVRTELEQLQNELDSLDDESIH